MAEIELINVLLGLDPFILIEFSGSDDDGLNLSLQYGGGPASADQAVALLLFALGEITGVPADDYMAAIDGARFVEGLPPLMDVLDD